jgi:hypothetical protein
VRDWPGSPPAGYPWPKGEKTTETHRMVRGC